MSDPAPSAEAVRLVDACVEKCGAHDVTCSVNRRRSELLAFIGRVEAEARAVVALAIDEAREADKALYDEGIISVAARDYVVIFDNDGKGKITAKLEGVTLSPKALTL